MRLTSDVPKSTNRLITHCYVWVWQMSILPKCNNGSFTHCYAWVRQMPNVPKCNNWSSIHCYIWVRQVPIVPKCNNWSLINCYVWVRQMAIVPKVHVYRINNVASFCSNIKKHGSVIFKSNFIGCCWEKLVYNTSQTINLQFIFHNYPDTVDINRLWPSYHDVVTFLTQEASHFEECFVCTINDWKILI